MAASDRVAGPTGAARWSPGWKTFLPSAFVVAVLAAMLVTPFFVQRRLDALRDEIEHAAEPARTKVTEVQYLLARQTSALRGFVISGDEAFLARYREMAERERAAYDSLAPLVERLSPEVRRRFLRLRSYSEEWHRRISESGFPEPGGGAASVPGEIPFEQTVYLEALRAASELDFALAEAARLRRRRLQDAERQGMALTFGLALVAAAAAVVVSYLNLRIQRLAAEAEARRVDAERAMEARARLLRGVTHDVKNPLGAADGFAALLAMGMQGPLSPGQAEYVGRVRRSIQSALEIIRDLLDLSGAEGGGLKVEPVDADLATLVREAVEDHGAAAERAGHTVDLRLPPEPLPVHTDPARVRQILGNLLSNAIKYTPPPGSIRVLAEDGAAGAGSRPGRWLAVHVEDSGPGIPEGMREAVFDEFVRLHDGRTEGHGLGLPVSRRIAQLLGGEVTVSSAPGGGSVFTLWLPHRESSLSPIRPAPPAAPARRER